MKNIVKTAGAMAFSAMVIAGGMFAASPATAEDVKPAPAAPAAAAAVADAAPAVAAAAPATNIKAVCEVALGKEGVKDFSGCGCLEGLVKDNAELEKHLISLADKGPGIAPRREVANDEGKKALDTCFKAPEKK